VPLEAAVAARGRITRPLHVQPPVNADIAA